MNSTSSFVAHLADYSVVCNKGDSFASNAIKGSVSASVVSFSAFVCCLGISFKLSFMQVGSTLLVCPFFTLAIHSLTAISLASVGSWLFVVSKH